jgi:hypothetical protein
MPELQQLAIGLSMAELATFILDHYFAAKINAS